MVHAKNWFSEPGLLRPRILAIRFQHDLARGVHEEMPGSQGGQGGGQRLCPPIAGHNNVLFYVQDTDCVLNVKSTHEFIMGIQQPIIHGHPLPSSRESQRLRMYVAISDTVQNRGTVQNRVF